MRVITSAHCVRCYLSCFFTVLRVRLISLTLYKLHPNLYLTKYNGYDIMTILNITQSGAVVARLAHDQ